MSEHGPEDFSLRHEWTTASGDELAIVIENDGVLRLLFLRPPQEDVEALPRDHAFALLALAADLLKDTAALAEACQISLPLLRGLQVIEAGKGFSRRSLSEAIATAEAALAGITPEPAP